MRKCFKNLIWLWMAACTLTANEGLAEEAAPQNPTNQVRFNLLDYGADPTGLNDSSPAFEKLLQAVGDRRQVHITIPAGVYRLANRVSLATEGNAVNYGMYIQGDGEDVTELRVDNPEGGIDFKGVNINRFSFTISDLSIVAAREVAGTALSFDTANPGDHHARQFNAENLLIRGDRFDTGSFTAGIEVRNAWYPRLENVKVTSVYGPQKGPDPMLCAILLEDCYSPLLQGCYVWGSRKGLVYRGRDNQPEDGIVSNSYFVANDECITVELVKQRDAWPEPGFHLSNCHISYRNRGVILNGVRQANISQSLFYCGDRTGTPWHSKDWNLDGGDEKTARAYEPRDIDLEHASDIIINDNIFTEPSNLSRVGIRIGPDSGQIIISNNQFNMSGTAIKNESSDPSYSSGNVFSGKPPWTGRLTPCLDPSGSMQRMDFDPPGKAGSIR